MVGTLDNRAEYLQRTEIVFMLHNIKTCKGDSSGERVEYEIVDDLKANFFYIYFGEFLPK